MQPIDILITGILFFIMLSVGLSLRWSSFLVTFGRPKAFFTGLALQMIYLPVLAFAVVTVLPLPMEFRVGVVILAACPGGMTSNFISYLLNANAALSISLTVTNSFLALLTTPLLVKLALWYFMASSADVHLPFWGTVQQIFLITIVPVFLGLLVRRWRPAWASRTEKSLKWVTVGLLAVLFLVKFFAGEDQGGSGITPQEVWTILPASVLVNALGLASGYVVGRWGGFSPNDQITMGVEVGIQNTSLAFLIAGSLLGNEAMLKPALVYAMFTFFTAVGYGLWIRPREGERIQRKFRKWLRSGQ